MKSIKHKNQILDNMCPVVVLFNPNFPYVAQHAILVHISRVNSEEHGTKVETVRYSPFNLVGQDSTKGVYSPVQSYLLLQSFYSILAILSNPKYHTQSYYSIQS